MKRVKGTAGVSLFECINADQNKWNVRWDVQENPETDEGQTNGVNYMEETFLFKPDLSDVQQIISFWCGSTEATAKFVLDGKTIECRSRDCCSCVARRRRQKVIMFQ